MLATILLISACGPEPVPTMSAEDVQGTAVAAAWTMVAETQAAIPTATPVPPTDTPPPTELPTNTVPPLEIPTQSAGLATQPAGLATQPVAAQPNATTANTDDCNRPLRSDAPGPTSPIKIINETKAPINISLYLERTVFGECGYRGYQVPRNGSINIEFPQGVIYAYAWLLEPVNTTVSGGPWRPNNTDKWEIYIRENNMKMVGP